MKIGNDRKKNWIFNKDVFVLHDQQFPNYNEPMEEYLEITTMEFWFAFALLSFYKNQQNWTLDLFFLKFS